MQFHRRAANFKRSFRVAGFALALVGPAAAQDGRLEEIVVTATKRAQSVQEIPMSVEVTSGEELAAYRITNMDDLSATIPNFVVAEGITNTAVVVRGLGSLGDRVFEVPVSMFVDDVYNSRTRQYRLPFFDVERVEILRGPQAVLFGLNSTAGAIAINSKSNRPGDPFEATVSAGYEAEYGGAFASAVIGGSPTETLGLRLAYQHSDSGDGFYYNTSSDEDQNSKKEDSLRFSIVWQPAEALTLTAKYSMVRFDMVDGSFGEIVNGIGPAIEPGDGMLDWRTSADTYLAERTGLPPGSKSEYDSVTLRADYEADAGTLSVIGSYSDFLYSLSTDIDMTTGGSLPGALFPIGVWSAATTDYQQTTLEVRWASTPGQAVDYIFGAYYQEYQHAEPINNGSEAMALAPSPAFIPFTDTRSGGQVDVDQELISLYGVLTLNISEALQLTGGLRYVDEQKDAVRTGYCEWNVGGSFIPSPIGAGTNCPAILSAEGDVGLSELMPEVAVQWSLGNVMLYGKYNETYKSGGFASANATRPDAFVYRAESAQGFEVGLKSTLADGAAELNIAAFITDFSDLQQNGFTTDNAGNVFAAVTNAAKAQSKGLELDGRWAASDWLTLSASIALLDAEFDEFTEAPCSRTAGAGGTITVCDLSDQSLPFATDWSANLAADLDYPLSDSLRLVGGLSLSFRDDYFTDTTLEPELIQDGYVMLAARVGVADAADRWSLTLSGLNLTDEAVISYSNILFGYDIAYLGAPRTLTLQGSYRFGN